MIDAYPGIIEMQTMMVIEQQRAEDKTAIEALLDVTFGRDRQQKAAYRLREGVSPVAGLSFVMLDGDELVGTLRFWPVKIANSTIRHNGLSSVGSDVSSPEDTVSALLLGPIAIKPELQGQGHGLALMAHGLKVARQNGHRIVLLVGDEAYYQKVGFSRELAKNIILPAVEDKNRFLAQELVPGSLHDIAGTVQADHS
ncbi:MAG: GNAT family N-acetyltransferase [Kordiimonas sp.]|nr:GNAT family N-acetyltransferase [Kordiimonas sp.]|tara:strand:+ start:123 stop:716 length:594 start_codon:yes stop_codon:yes gene_type:complete